MRLFSVLFWGIFLLASGLIILLKVAFNLQNVSAGRLIFGLFVLMIGVSLLTSNFRWGSNVSYGGENTVLFSSEQTVEAKDGNSYLVLFGSSNYDLTDLEPGSHVRIDCAFGSCRIRLPRGAVQVNSNCAFGNIRMPDGANIPFGGGTYSTDGDNKVTVDVSCVFGGATINNQ